MTVETNDGGNAATEPVQPEQDAVIENDDSDLTNRDVKNHPLFKKLAAQLSEKETAEQKRLEAAELAESEKAANAAKERGDFEEALKLEQQKTRAAEQRALKNEIKAEIAARGANPTKGLVAVAVAEFEAGEHESTAEFIKALAANDDYSSFFQPATGSAQRMKAPPGATVSGSTGTMTNEQIRQLQKSSDRGERVKAREYLKTYREKNGGYPPGF